MYSNEGTEVTLKLAFSDQKDFVVLRFAEDAVPIHKLWFIHLRLVGFFQIHSLRTTITLLRTDRNNFSKCGGASQRTDVRMLFFRGIGCNRNLAIIGFLAILDVVPSKGAKNFNSPMKLNGACGLGADAA